jgi:cytochrome P450
VTTNTNVTLPPGPAPAKTFLEQLHLMRKFAGNFLPLTLDWKQQYGDVYVVQFGELKQYMISHPDHIHQVTTELASKFHKDNDYKNPRKGLARFLGSGLLTSDGEFWKRQRKLSAPAFHHKRIAAYAGTMVDYTDRLLREWQSNSRLDIAEEMTRLTMLIVAKALFNTDVSSEVERTGEAVEAIQRFMNSPRLLPTWIPTRLELAARHASNDLDEIVYRIINERRASGEDTGDLLSMLLLAQDDEGKHMTDKQARDEVVTLFLAGHETTANTMNWTWYLLAQYPEVEAKLHEELDRVLGGRLPTFEDLEHLKYTEMVIKESMRILPPVWVFSRVAIEDVEIGGYHIEKGSVVAPFTYALHHDPRWWENPETFDPERFSPENEHKINRRAYLPFASGPRVCIGNGFAMMEARLILATIASRYRLSLAPGQQVEIMPRLTLNPKDGLPMTVTEREPVKVMA